MSQTRKQRPGEWNWGQWGVFRESVL